MYNNTHKLHIHITTQTFKITNFCNIFDGFCFEKFRAMYQDKFNMKKVTTILLHAIPS